MFLLLPVELDFFFRSWCDLRDGVGTTGDGLVAALALPDTNSLALHGVLSAEGADVTGVLRNFGLLDLLTQRGTVSVEKKGFWSISRTFDSGSPILVRCFTVVWAVEVITVVRGCRRGRGFLGVEHTWYRTCR
jgi:hypothetical protein